MPPTGQTKDHSSQASTYPTPGKAEPPTTGPRTQQGQPGREQSHPNDTNGKPQKKKGWVGSHGDEGGRGQAATHPTTVEVKPRPATTRSTIHEGAERDRQKDHR